MKFADKLDFAINKIDDNYILCKEDKLRYDDGTQSMVGGSWIGHSLGEIKEVICRNPRSYIRERKITEVIRR